jgi:hypothetical protein
MVTSRVVRIDEDVYRALQEQGRPFEDTPNTVLRRLLQLPEDAAPPAAVEPEAAGNAATARRQRGGGDRTPQEAFARPILEAIVELGGKARVADILNRVNQKVQLTPLDQSRVRSGLPRWQVYARWQRQTMVNDGLLGGEHGYWEITAEGRRFLRAEESRYRR